MGRVDMDSKFLFAASARLSLPRHRLDSLPRQRLDSASRQTIDSLPRQRLSNLAVGLAHGWLKRKTRRVATLE
jgi:hypothetical protein